MKQGPWTDVYALAAVVYFAIQGRTPPVSVGRMMGDSYQPLAESARGLYSAGFLAAVDRALKVKPEDRTQSVGAFRADMGLGPGAVPDVQTVMHGDSPPAAASRAAATAARSGQAPPAAAFRTGLWIGVGTGVLLLGAAGAFFALTPGAPPAPTALPAPAPTPAQASAVAPVVEAAPPAPTPAPAPFTVAAELDKILAAQTPGFDIEAVAQRSQLRVGRDRLVLDITSSRDGYVYLFVHGPDGSLVLLHPSNASTLNRVRAGRKLRLPPAPVEWQVFEPAGTERLLVMVSATPRDFDAAGAQRQDGLLTFPVGEAGAERARRFTGAGSFFSGSALNCVAGDADCNAYGADLLTVEIVK